MPKLEFTDEELTAVAAALRKLIDEDRFPFSPRLKPPKPKAPPPPPIASASEAAIRRRKRAKRISGLRWLRRLPVYRDERRGSRS